MATRNPYNRPSQVGAAQGSAPSTNQTRNNNASAGPRSREPISMDSGVGQTILPISGRTEYSRWTHGIKLTAVQSSSAPLDLLPKQEDGARVQIPSPKINLSLPPTEDGSRHIDVLRYCTDTFWFNGGFRVPPGSFETFGRNSARSLVFIPYELASWNYVPPVYEFTGDVGVSSVPENPTLIAASTPASGLIVSSVDALSTPIVPPSNLRSDYKEKIKIQVAPTTGYASSNGLFDTPEQEASAPDWWKNNDSWRTFVGSNLDNRVFQDLVFDMRSPYLYDPVSDVENAGVESRRDHRISVEPFYNFYIKDFEEVSSLPSVPGPLLPSLYVFASEFNSEFLDNENSRFKKFIDLVDKDGVRHVQGTFVDILREIRNGSEIRDIKIGESDKGQYFEKWADAISEIYQYQVPGTLRQKFENLVNPYSNLVVSANSLNILSEAANKEKMFPMGIKLEFSTDINCNFADMLRDTSLSSALIKYVINNQEEPDKIVDFQLDFKNWSESGELGFDDYKSVNTWNLEDWLNGVTLDQDLKQVFRDGINDLDPFDKEVFLGSLDEELGAVSCTSNVFYASLMMSILKNNAESLIDSNFRTYKDILEGKLAYSETVLYKICRHTYNQVGQLSPDPEQVIWVSNTSDLDILTYVDTQVKRGTPYAYRIYAFQMVVGNEYTYEVETLGGDDINPIDTGNETIFKLDNFMARICVANNPSVRLAMVPFYFSEWNNPNGLIVADSPPVPPNVNVYPYIGESNKVLIWLNGATGDFWSRFQKLQEVDIPAQNELLRFKNDDPISFFEIFRINQMPKTYGDFIGTRPLRVSTDGASAASFVDESIQPNRKYYYTFRALDIQGRASNPSEVYEVEIVKTDENVYTLVQVVDMAREPIKQATKSVRKFLQIKPSLLQTILKENELQYARNSSFIPIEFQNPGESIWGSGQSANLDKKFKVRINSKRTGKKIDINLKFKISSDIDVRARDARRVTAPGINVRFTPEDTD